MQLAKCSVFSPLSLHFRQAYQIQFHFESNDFQYLLLLYFSTESTCGPDKFRCTNGQCIPKRYTCDEEADCADGSDELPSSCRKYFSCLADQPKILMFQLNMNFVQTMLASASVALCAAPGIVYHNLGCVTKNPIAGMVRMNPTVVSKCFGFWNYTTNPEDIRCKNRKERRDINIVVHTHPAHNGIHTLLTGIPQLRNDIHLNACPGHIEYHNHARPPPSSVFHFMTWARLKVPRHCP